MKRGVLQQRRALVEAIKLQEVLLDFSMLLHPLNEDDEKNKFLSNEIENPTFTYQQLNIPNFALSDVIEEGPIDQLYKERIELTENLTKLAQSIGDDEEFSSISQKVFPIIDLDNQSSIINPPLEHPSPKDSAGQAVGADDEIEAEDTKERFIEELRNQNIEGWAVKIVNNISSRLMVSYPERFVRIKKGISISKNELEELTRHEIGGHVLRSANGRMQAEPLLHIGTAKGRLFEEGVACYLENPEGPYRIFLRHFAVKQAQNSSFREVFNQLTEKGLTQDEAWSMTLRVKRGLTDTSKKGGFTRDAIYAQAFVEMQEYIKNDGDINILLAAPIHPNEISLLTDHTLFSIEPSNINNKKILMIGYRGKESHIKTAKENGVMFDLLIDKSEMKPEYKNLFTSVYVLDDIFDWNEINKEISEQKYNGVMTRFEDFTILVSAIAEHLNLPAVSFEDSIKFRNKFKMREAFANGNVPSADFALVSSISDADEMISKHGFPLIIKQISGIHSKYVAKVESREELEKTIDFYLKSLSKENGTLHGSLKNYPDIHEAPNHLTNLLLEECLEGEELTVDAFVVNGEVFLTPICKYVLAHEIGVNDHHLPIRIMPYDLKENQQKVVFDTVEASLKSLGANFCGTHVEVFYNKEANECAVIEVASRGGGFRAEMVSKTCGGDYDLGLVRSALALPPNVKNIPSNHVAVVEIFSPENGILKFINTSFIENRDDISHITWNRKIGEEVGKASDGKSFILKFMVEAKTYNEVKKKAEELLLNIKESIEIEN